MAYFEFTDGTVADLGTYVPTDAKRITLTAFKIARTRNARRDLLAILAPGSTLYTVHKGSSAHRVVVAQISDGGRPYLRDITGLVADAAGFKRNRDGDITQGGGGYSKAFQICYSLGSCLWPNGTPEPHGTRNGEPDTAGGYALKHDTI